MCDMTTIENDLRVRLFLFLRIHRDKKKTEKEKQPQKQKGLKMTQNNKDVKTTTDTVITKCPQRDKKNAKPLETDVKQTQRQRQGPEKDTKKSDIKQPHTDQS